MKTVIHTIGHSPTVQVKSLRFKCVVQVYKGAFEDKVRQMTDIRRWAVINP